VVEQQVVEQQVVEQQVVEQQSLAGLLDKMDLVGLVAWPLNGS
jgi:hypothetical protein